MTPQQLTFWNGVFEKLVETEAWKEELNTSLVENNYMNSTRALEFMKTQYATLRTVLTELGLAR